jgi:hypothetical protein
MEGGKISEIQGIGRLLEMRRGAGAWAFVLKEVPSLEG